MAKIANFAISRMILYNLLKNRLPWKMVKISKSFFHRKVHIPSFWRESSKDSETLKIFANHEKFAILRSFLFSSNNRFDNKSQYFDWAIYKTFMILDKISPFFCLEITIASIFHVIKRLYKAGLQRKLRFLEDDLFCTVFKWNQLM